MENLIIAFITGLTTGGLSCLAVQGGLLASSLSNQIEQGFSQVNGKQPPSRTNPAQSQFGLPIVIFLLAKIIAYTLLGFVLGLLGQIFQMSLLTRAILQIAIGLFMLGSALRMLNVHPIFRYFAFEPPAAFRRKLRKTAEGSNGSRFFSPALLGLFTVLIPCGVTQAMMAVALGTGNPFQGAALLFAFTLGTSPVFFAVAYFATKMGAKLEKHFMRLVAVLILVLAIITIDSGISLAGSPVSITRWLNNVRSTSSTDPVNSSPSSEVSSLSITPDYLEAGTTQTTASAHPEGTILTIQVKNNGYSPDVIHAKADTPIMLQLVSDDVRSCSRAFVIPALNIQLILESTGTALLEIPSQSAGTQIPFSCSMGMYTGTIIFDL